MGNPHLELSQIPVTFISDSNPNIEMRLVAESNSLILTGFHSNHISFLLENMKKKKVMTIT